MKKCPKCNRLYSDFTDRCPECNISLSGGQDALNSINNTYQQLQPSYQQPQNIYEQPQNTYQQPQNTYEQPQPSYQQPQNAYQHPQPSYQQPQNAYQQPWNAYQQPQNTYQGGSAVVKPEKYTLLTILCAVAIIMFWPSAIYGFIQRGKVMKAASQGEADRITNSTIKGILIIWASAFAFFFIVNVVDLL